MKIYEITIKNIIFVLANWNTTLSHIIIMKKLYLIIILLIGTLSVYGQNPDSLKVIARPLTEIQRDSLLTDIQRNVYNIADATYDNSIVGRYKVYSTTNIYISLKLDTATGRITMLQVGINKDSDRMECSVCDAVSSDSRIIGRYELHPTGNMYNFILIDTIFGGAYQVQWSTNTKNCGIWRIW